MKFVKRLVVVLTAVCIMGICGCGTADYTFSIESNPDFRNYNLGCSSSDILSSETLSFNKEMNIGDKKMLVYSDVEIDGFNATTIYQFDKNDRFESGILYLFSDDTAGVFSALSKKCDSLYGSTRYFASPESITWMTDDKVITVINSNEKVVYNVCTQECYYN